MTMREHEDGELGLRTDLYELVDLGDVEHDCEPTAEDARGISDNGLVRGKGCGHAWGLVRSEAGIAWKRRPDRDLWLPRAIVPDEQQAARDDIVTRMHRFFRQDSGAWL